MNTIQQTIRRLCELEGSQTKFAKRIGATPQKVNNWVNGRNEPGADMLYAISEAYSIPMSSLVDQDRANISRYLSALDPAPSQDADELSIYMSKMTDKQRRAVLGVARAMVDC